MALPTPVKTWNFARINRRLSFISLNDMMATLLFEWKTYLVTTMGWTIKYTCDGVTGPTSGADNTDRWLTKANCTTRGNPTGTTASSFAVLVDGNGVQLLLSFSGNTDDIAHIAFSNGALYVPAGTATNRPTATDESVLATGVTILGALASTDRVYHLLCTTDRKMMRLWVFRAGAMQKEIFLEACNSTVNVGFNWTTMVVGGQNSSNIWGQPGQAGGSMQATTAVAGAANCQIARIGGTNVGVGGGGEGYLGVLTGVPFTPQNPVLNGGALIIPLVFASNTTNFEGKIGNRIDAWYGWANGTVVGDIFGNFELVAFNTMLQPWDGFSGVMTA